MRLLDPEREEGGFMEELTLELGAGIYVST